MDSQIIYVTEIDDMEQEMLDTDDFNYTLESTIRKYKNTAKNCEWKRTIYISH